MTGIKDSVSFPSNAARLQGLAEYRTHQIFSVPERASVLRVAVRDVSRNKVGSIEIPIWAVSNPYQRRRLHIPIVAQDVRQEINSP